MTPMTRNTQGDQHLRRKSDVYREKLDPNHIQATRLPA